MEAECTPPPGCASIGKDSAGGSKGGSGSGTGAAQRRERPASSKRKPARSAGREPAQCRQRQQQQQQEQNGSPQSTQTQATAAEAGTAAQGMAVTHAAAAAGAAECGGLRPSPTTAWPSQGQEQQEVKLVSHALPVCTCVAPPVRNCAGAALTPPSPAPGLPHFALQSQSEAVFVELLRRVPAFADRVAMLAVGTTPPAKLSGNLHEARRGVELRQIAGARQLHQQPATEQQQAQQVPTQQEAAQPEALQQVQQSLQAALEQAKHLAALLGQAC